MQAAWHDGIARVASAWGPGGSRQNTPAIPGPIAGVDHLAPKQLVDFVARLRRSAKSHGNAVAQLAQHFWEEYLGTGNVAYGCLEAVNAPEVPEVLDFLNSFGYANPSYVAEELCPFLTP